VIRWLIVCLLLGGGGSEHVGEAKHMRYAGPTVMKPVQDGLRRQVGVNSQVGYGT
jgi:hypothetical protein